MRLAPLLALAAALIAGPCAAQQMLLTGAGTGAGGVGYIPDGVQFTPQATLGVKGATLGANSGTDTPYGIMGYWMRTNIGSSANHTLAQNSQYYGWLTEFNGSFDDETYTAESVPGYTNVVDNGGGFGCLRWSPHDSTGGNVQTNHTFLWTQCNTLQSLNAKWHYYLIVWNFNFADAGKRLAVYIDGVKQATAGTPSGALSNPFIPNINTAFGWGLNSQVGNVGNKGGYFDVADLFFDISGAIPAGCASQIDASNNVCSAILAATYAGGPVNPGANCQNILGVTPAVCLRGVPSSFVTNKGSATGAITLFNNLTSNPVATPVLFKSSINPGQTLGHPYWKWSTQQSASGLTGTSTSYVTNNMGGPIATGDLLLLAVNFAESTSPAVNRAIQTPTGWTIVPTTGAAAGTCVTTTQLVQFPVCNNTLPMNAALFYRVAQAGEVTAAGSDWSSPPTVAWTQNGTAFRDTSWLMMDYGGANATTPIQNASAQYNTTSTSAIAPPVTPTTASTELLTMTWAWGFQFELTTPGSQDVRYKQFSANSGNIDRIAASDETLSGTSATGTRTSTLSSTEISITANVVIGP